MPPIRRHRRLLRAGAALGLAIAGAGWCSLLLSPAQPGEGPPRRTTQLAYSAAWSGLASLAAMAVYVRLLEPRSAAAADDDGGETLDGSGNGPLPLEWVYALGVFAGVAAGAALPADLLLRLALGGTLAGVAVVGPGRHVAQRRRRHRSQKAREEECGVLQPLLLDV